MQTLCLPQPHTGPRAPGQVRSNSLERQPPSNPRPLHAIRASQGFQEPRPLPSPLPLAGELRAPSPRQPSLRLAAGVGGGRASRAFHETRHL